MEIFKQTQVVENIKHLTWINQLHARKVGHTEQYVILTPRACFNIYRSRNQCALSILPVAHSCLHMNYVSSDHMCMAYPLTSHLYSAVLRHKPISDIRAHCVADWYRTLAVSHDDSKWLPLRARQSACDLPYMCPDIERSFGDSGCLTFTFASLANDTCPPDYDRSWTVTWTLGGPQCVNTERERRYSVQVQLVYIV